MSERTKHDNAGGGPDLNLRKIQWLQRSAKRELASVFGNPNVLRCRQFGMPNAVPREPLKRHVEIRPAQSEPAHLFPKRGAPDPQ
jgi:hypothetical protein